MLTRYGAENEGVLRAGDVIEAIGPERTDTIASARAIARSTSPASTRWLHGTEPASRPTSVVDRALRHSKVFDISTGM